MESHLSTKIETPKLFLLITIFLSLYSKIPAAVSVENDLLMVDFDNPVCWEICRMLNPSTSVGIKFSKVNSRGSCFLLHTLNCLRQTVSTTNNNE